MDATDDGELVIDVVGGGVGGVVGASVVDVVVDVVGASVVDDVNASVITCAADAVVTISLSPPPPLEHAHNARSKTTTIILFINIFNPPMS